MQDHMARRDAILRKKKRAREARFFLPTATHCRAMTHGRTLDVAPAR
jgi:hypothetical protein